MPPKTAENSLVFLGAGASKPFGIPTMQEMVDKFEERLERDDAKCFALYSRIKNTLVNAYGDSIDIESVFSVLHGMESQITAKDLGHYAYFIIKTANVSPVGEFPSETVSTAKKTLDYLQDYIKNSCQLRLDKINDVYNKSYVPLFSFMKGKKQNYTERLNLATNWKSYTTNYDLVFESFWQPLDGDIHDHFSKERNSNNYCFSQHNLDPKSFCKLHGSINWTRTVEDGKIIRKINNSYSVYETKGDVMLFPIQQKDLYLHPWFLMFADLRDGLASQDTWYVIGYAFNDEFIRDMFEEALRSYKDKKLVIINPDADNIKQKFPQAVMDCIDSLPILFGGDHFGRQFEDYEKSTKTLSVRMLTRGQTIRIRCDQQITQWSASPKELLAEDQATGARGSGKKNICINTKLASESEVKILITVYHPFGEEISLWLSDNTEHLSAGIDYDEVTVARLHMKGKHERDSHGVIWIRDSIVLGKRELFDVAPIPIPA